MAGREKCVSFRTLALIATALGACGYDMATVTTISEGTSSSVSSSSQGAGGMPGSEVSSSSMGGGGMPFPAGVGGLGGVPITSSVSTSSSGEMGGAGGGNNSGTGGNGGNTSGSGGGPVGDPTPVIQDCGGGDCDVSTINICCQWLTGGASSCDKASSCITGQYELKCDDKADCGNAAYCCMVSYKRAECTANCATTIVCKDDPDCPPGHLCNMTGGPRKYCN